MISGATPARPSRDGFYLTVTATPEVFGTGALDVEAIAQGGDGGMQESAVQ